MRSWPRLERTTAADVVGDDEANVEALGGGFDGGTGGTGATLRSAAYRLIERTYDGVGLVTEKKDALRLGQIDEHGFADRLSF